MVPLGSHSASVTWSIKEVGSCGRKEIEALDGTRTFMLP